MCHGKDPRNVDKLPAFRELPKISRKKYITTWLAFVKKYDIAIGKVPREADFYDFLEKKFDAGIVSSTLRSNYSHLNLAVCELYGGMKLNIFPSLYRFIKSAAKKSPCTKKARPFEPEVRFSNLDNGSNILNQIE